MGRVTTPALRDSAFLRACRGEPVPHTPVWFMRQAGRSLPEYRALREGVGMLESCLRPDLVTEITLQPVRRHGVDAAILFSDIVLPLKAVGVDLDIVPGVGPVVAKPVRTRADLDTLRALEPDDVAPVAEAVRQPRARARGRRRSSASPVRRSPWRAIWSRAAPRAATRRTKALMLGDPELWHDLLARLAQISRRLPGRPGRGGGLGRAAVRLVGRCAERGRLPGHGSCRTPSRSSTRSVASGVPRIHFGVGTGELLARDGGVGRRRGRRRLPRAAAARRRVGSGPKPLQGNLDPAVLFAPWDVVEAETRRVLADGADLPGHVFNLGHGVMPATDPDVLTRLVALVHEASAGRPAA